MKSKRLITLLLLSLLITPTLLLLYANQSQAQSLSISINPALTHLQITPPGQTTAPLTLENNTDEQLDIKIILKPFHPVGENGAIEYNNQNQTEEKYKKLFSKIIITDNQTPTTSLIIQPRQKRNLKINININHDEKDADYYFSIIFLTNNQLKAENLTRTNIPTQQFKSFQSNPQIQDLDPASKNQKNYSLINAGIAANILLSIGSKHPNGNIQEFSTSPYVNSGPVNFTLRMKNTGNHLYKPTGMILITNMFGQTIGRVDIKPENILAGSIRSLTQIPTLTSTAAKYQELPLDHILWNENFLLGLYTASLTIALSEKGPIYKQSITFFAFPLYALIITILLIVITIYLIIRIKYYIKYIK